MLQTEINKESVSALICPALNILRAIELELTGHDCPYKVRAKEATNNLMKLLVMSEKLK